MEVVMKRKAIIPLLLSVMCGFWGCNREFGPAPRPAPALYVIKFKQPEYKNHIMTVSPPEGVETILYGAKFALPVSMKNLYGQSPYVELSGGYLLIDWHWGRVYYPDNEAIISEKWEDFHYDPDVNFAEWSIDKLYVKYPVKECYTFAPRRIEEYLHGKDHLVFDLANIYFSEKEWDEFTDGQKALRLREIAWNDSLYKVYIPALCRIIEEGKLDDYGYKWKLKHD